MKKSEAMNYRKDINALISNLNDEDALDVTDLFEPWMDGKTYATDDRVKYESNLYKCLQAHTAQSDWTPDVAVSLWVNVANPHEEWPEWRQPVGAQDAYELGAKVSHNEKHWISNVNANVWEPGVYGWDEVVGE